MCGYASLMVVSFFAVYCVGEGDCTLACMSSAPGTTDGIDFSRSNSPPSAAVNESGLIFLYLLHTAYNLGDETDQEHKTSDSILLHLWFKRSKMQNVGYRCETA